MVVLKGLTAPCAPPLGWGAGAVFMIVTLAERKFIIPSSYCPWPVPIALDTNNNDRNYFGGHLDTKHTNPDRKPFKAATSWPRELTRMGYLPKNFDKILTAVGVPQKRIRPLLKKLSRMCRHHTKVRREAFRNTDLNVTSDDPRLTNTPATAVTTEAAAADKAADLVQDLII